MRRWVAEQGVGETENYSERAELATAYSFCNLLRHTENWYDGSYGDKAGSWKAPKPLQMSWKMR